MERRFAKFVLCKSKASLSFLIIPNKFYWSRVSGKVMRGLMNRRAKERKLFEKAL